MNNYWNNNDVIPTKKEIEKELEYEIRMFRDTCREWSNMSKKSQFQKNLLVESLATHSRVLIDFFYNDKNPKYSDDLVAQDFLNDDVNWKTERPGKSDFLKEVKNKADKQLAHLTLWRVKINREGIKRGWNADKISEEIENIISKFEELKNKQ